MRTTRALALLSGAGALIHASVVADHFGEDPLLGWFFVAVVVLQVGWAALLLGRPSHRVLAVGAMGNALLAAVWVLSRTIGIPLGPDAWTAESIGIADTLATAFELASVLIVVGAFRRGWMRSPAPEGALVRWIPVGAVTALSAAIIAGGLTDHAASSLAHGHTLHFALLGAAGLVFSGYLGVEFSRHGIPTFSWHLRPPA